MHFKKPPLVYCDFLWKASNSRLPPSPESTSDWIRARMRDFADEVASPDAADPMAAAAPAIEAHAKDLLVGRPANELFKAALQKRA